MKPFYATLTAGCCVLVSTGAALSQDAPSSDPAELAKKLANPIASLISVPFQLNYDEGFGTSDGKQWQLNIQPVIPFDLNGDWNLIVRTIFPVISQDGFAPGSGDESGLGDITQSFFFSPKTPTANGTTWGVGPVFLYPSASNDSLGSEKWGAGLTGVALRQQGPWTAGALANHIWSVAGDSNRADINATFLQPFVAYGTPKGTTFAVNTETTYDWETEQWSVPINFQVNQMVKLGRQPAQIGIGARYWADSPDGGPEGWGLRLNFVLLYPK